MANSADAAAKLERFIHWLQVNGVEMRGCEIKYCDTNKGFGLFSTRSSDVSDGVLLVVPLDLSITPMRVLQDPILGPECRAMYNEGEVDDRFLMLLFLTVERLRKNSSWKPYFDVLPTNFSNPLWFTDDELLELKGTTLHRATELQNYPQKLCRLGTIGKPVSRNIPKWSVADNPPEFVGIVGKIWIRNLVADPFGVKINMLSLYNDKVKNLVIKLLVLDGNTESDVCFEDFLWANSIFWTRALNIPFPRSYVFPPLQNELESSTSNLNPKASTSDLSIEVIVDGEGVDHEVEKNVAGVTSASVQGETVWVEGLVPGIDFCNHDVNTAATWEVDGTGLATGVPFSMYLLSAGQSHLQNQEEISISYGSKGNEELLYLYGFVMDNNPDDYLMVHYPAEAIQSLPCSESKMQLLEAQKAELRCLLPRSLLDNGFFPACNLQKKSKDKYTYGRVRNYSWSGQREIPGYVDKLVFPEDLLTTLRTLAMQEDEIYQVAALLQELVGSDGERQPNDSEVRAAIWEVCGDSGALQLLVDLLNVKLMDLEEGSGREEDDNSILENGGNSQIPEENPRGEESTLTICKPMNKNQWACVVYRRGQKQLVRLFLNEAEHALELALSEGS